MLISKFEWNITDWVTLNTLSYSCTQADSHAIYNTSEYEGYMELYQFYAEVKPEASLYVH
jgi:hypothetical protein